jgi:hypothetical protein
MNEYYLFIFFKGSLHIAKNIFEHETTSEKPQFKVSHEERQFPRIDWRKNEVTVITFYINSGLLLFTLEKKN